MHLISLTRPDGTLGVCLQLGDELVDLTAAGCPATVDELLLLGEEAPSIIRRAADQSRTRYSPSEVNAYQPPITAPRKALAVGLNYVEHAKEGKREIPDYPVLFTRYPSSWVGHGSAIIKPSVSEKFDYEGELVAIIGKSGKDIPTEKALDHVAGYSIFNDGSVRDFQWRSSQWTMGKNFDSSGSFGPSFVDASSLPFGAKGLKLQTRLNGIVVQEASTDDMIFDIATLVSICSQAMTLHPGDIILTGTPSGVGFARQPPLFMNAGDLCEVEIEGVGTLSNRIEDAR